MTTLRHQVFWQTRTLLTEVSSMHLVWRVNWKIRGVSWKRVKDLCTSPPPSSEMQPSFSYLLLKFVYLASQLHHSLVEQPLLRKILDPPLKITKVSYYFIILLVVSSHCDLRSGFAWSIRFRQVQKNCQELVDAEKCFCFSENLDFNVSRHYKANWKRIWIVFEKSLKITLEPLLI